MVWSKSQACAQSTAPNTKFLFNAFITMHVMFVYLSWSRPTPHTRMLLIGWEWSRLRSSGSTSVNMRSWSTNSIPLPCKTMKSLCSEPVWDLTFCSLACKCVINCKYPSHWPPPTRRLSPVCPFCSRTAVLCSGGRPHCSFPHTGPALPSPSSPEIEQETTEDNFNK